MNAFRMRQNLVFAVFLPALAILSGCGSSPSDFTLVAPAASLSVRSLAFPATNVGSSAQAQTVILSNTGNTSLKLTGITLAGANPSDFAETTTCAATLAIASTCTLSITFTPTTANTFTAALIVTDNNNPSTQTVSLTGAGIVTPPPGAFAGTAFTGRVLAGNLPVIGAAVQIYAAGVSGNGSSGTQLLSTPQFTDANGAFSVSTPYSCPLGSSILYIVATGGQAGPTGASNSGTVLMSSPGACSSIAAGASYTLNELTTVAAAYAFSQFLSTGAKLGATATNGSGITLATATLANLVGISTGVSPGPAFPSTGTVPSAELNALANVLNACIVSTGPGSSACSSFFSSAAVAGIAPDNTLDAIMNVAKNPAANVSALYTLSTGSKAYSPVPAISPRDWTFFVNFTGGGMNNPTALAVDSAGRVWVASYKAVASLFSNTGVPAFPSGITGDGLCDSFGLAVDAADHAWIVNYADTCGGSSVTVLNPAGAELANYTAGGIYFPESVAIDSFNDAWIANYGNSRLVILGNDGSPLSGPAGYTGVTASTPAEPNIYFPTGIAVDSNRDGWLANSSGTYITKISPDGVTFTQYPTGSSPVEIAIDSANNVWVSNFGSSTLGLVTSTGTILSGANGYTGGGLDHPQGIAVDGAGNAWAANYRHIDSTYGDSLSELSGAASPTPGTPLSPSIGYGTDANMLEAFGIAIDASGNIWVTNYALDTLTEFIGLAAPVKTPLTGFTRIP